MSEVGCSCNVHPLSKLNTLNGQLWASTGEKLLCAGGRQRKVSSTTWRLNYYDEDETRVSWLIEPEHICCEHRKFFVTKSPKPYLNKVTCSMRIWRTASQMWSDGQLWWRWVTFSGSKSFVLWEHFEGYITELDRTQWRRQLYLQEVERPFMTFCVYM